jgi:short subunit dehydrogenase-like uncharacterized protein
VERRRIGLLGATGYTGQRVLRELLTRSEEPTLVGRPQRLVQLPLDLFLFARHQLQQRLTQDLGYHGRPCL